MEKGKLLMKKSHAVGGEGMAQMSQHRQRLYSGSNEEMRRRRCIRVKSGNGSREGRLEHESRIPNETGSLSRVAGSIKKAASVGLASAAFGRGENPYYFMGIAK